MNKIIFFPILIITFLSSCSSIKTVAPVAKTETEKIPLKTSYISLPIEIDVKDLEKKINQEVKGLLYEDNSYEGDNLKVKAWKKENFVYQLDGNEIFYSIPLKISIQYKKFVEFPEVMAEITLKFKTEFNIAKDWSLNTKTLPLGFDWHGSEGISVGGFQLPLQTIADLILKANQQSLGSEIDNAIKAQVNLKSIANQGWNQLHQPILVNDDPKLWLKVQPSELTMVPLTGKNGKINLSVALKSTNEILWSSSAPAYQLNKFPEVKLVQKLTPDMALNFTIDLPFNEINEMAKKEIIGKTFSSGKKKVIVKGFNSYSSAEFVVVELLLEGSLKGFIYLKGKPVYDKNTKTIEIKEIEFDLDTKNKLYKSAEWLLHQNILKLLEEQLKFPINDKLEEAKKMVNQNLKENRQLKGVLIKGAVNQLDIEQIYLMPNSLKVAVILIGKVAVYVDGLSKM